MSLAPAVSSCRICSFKKEQGSAPETSPGKKIDRYGNLAFFLGVGATSFFVWVAGTAVGYGVALGFPAGFEEALKFILPGYFAALLTVEMRGWSMALLCLAALLTAVPGALASPGWGWLVTAMLAAVLIWGLEEWKCRASKSS